MRAKPGVFNSRLNSERVAGGKPIDYSYSKFEKKSNGVFSGFLSFIDPEIF
jgi:hypothetical protein